MQNNFNFTKWETNHIKIWVDSFEEFTLSSHQINNLHLYHQAIAELYRRFPDEQMWQYRHWYFSEENQSGDYRSYLEFIQLHNHK